MYNDNNKQYTLFCCRGKLREKGIIKLIPYIVSDWITQIAHLLIYT